MMFEPPARLQFQLVKFFDHADPLFDITLVNTTDMPVVVTAVGIQI